VVRLDRIRRARRKARDRDVPRLGRVLRRRNIAEVPALLASSTSIRLYYVP
jgi:hypothetical protein